ncbi:MAG: ATP-dependent DNA helicase RecG [Clostridiales bacterium]|nr:ATP-dependent DNA helicase RecG [Clostridiales bacterium]
MQFEEIRGFGEKRIQKLKEAGLTNPADLLTIFPSKYIFRNSKISDYAVSDEAALVMTLKTLPVTKFVRKGLSFVRAEFEIYGQTVDCVWFNQPYVKKQLVPGRAYAIVGKVKKASVKPEIYVSSFTAANLTDEVITIYRPYSGIPSKTLKDAILQILGKVNIQGQISDDFCCKNGILSLNICIKTLHLPKNQADLAVAKEHASLQILAFNLAAFLLVKGQNSKIKANKYSQNMDALRNVIKSLPFVLTDSQQKTISQIVQDLHSDRRMNRLIEGDVGCGKTVVAFLAMYYAAMSGYQAALMAPTEILARQHYEKAVGFFGETFRCEFLCASQSKDRREDALFNIATGNAQIVIGTHSIFQDAVKFKNLSLTIADEQHRFGVEQRGNLENKGIMTDTLVMSATPIPRTLALTLYGDLDISVIDTLPQGKAQIFTRFVPKHKESDMLDYIHSKALDGEKAYVVCPRVEDDSSVSAMQMYKNLCKRYGGIVGLIHGQMRECDKTRVMNEFSSGQIMILVSTTIIEVGIDVPDATNIIIYDAEMYGLSQLHQLRGRVGRGKKDSFCFVVTKGDGLDDRLEYFIKTSNGFELAEYDFKVRGAGDFLGKRQHGESGIFFGQKIDAEFLTRAKRLADKLIVQGEISSNCVENYDYIKGLTLN